MNERVTIRQNFDRIDYQIAYSQTLAAGVNATQFVGQMNSLSIQNKKLRLVGLKMMSVYTPAIAGNFQNCDIVGYVGSGVVPFGINGFTNCVIPLIPKTSIALNGGGSTGAAVAGQEEPQVAYYNSKWQGNVSYNHVYTNDITFSIYSFFNGPSAINDIVMSRVWMTFIQEKT